jgi:NodT family efflux transporter outer membrane factor (OMF) lipoprotein
VLNDPAIDNLIGRALTSNPTLEEALARVDQARAQIATDRAAQRPQVSLGAAIGTGRSASIDTDGTRPSVSGLHTTTATIGPSLSWEVDLWGRLRAQTEAARSRLNARNADAAYARLSIAAQIADTVIVLRACHLSLAVRDNDIGSRRKELEIARARLTFGNIAPADVAATETNLATARTDRIATDAECRRTTNIIVALSGQNFTEVEALIAGPLHASGTSDDLLTSMPSAPVARPGLPAIVLLHHPSVIAAEREAAARWSEIAVSRAERLPRFNLGAILSAQWLGALGSTVGYSSWSAGPNLSVPLFDGGSGAARIRMSQGRYREAVATLDRTLRGAGQDIEDALVDQQSAVERAVTAREAVIAARFTLRANEARWRAGAIAAFQLESSRRDFDAAQDTAVVAARDRARAWVRLVRTTGSMPESLNGFETATMPASEREFQ